MKVKDNKGYSLVELIIVIAIMAILAGVISLSVIRYINKARKAHDIETAEAIGKSLQAAVAGDEQLFDFVMYATSTYGNNMEANPSDNKYYRVLGFANVPTGTHAKYAMDFHVINTALPDELKNVDLAPLIKEYIEADLVPLKFEKDNALDEWIICADKSQNIYIFVGAGMNDNRYFISKNGVNDMGNGRQCYMIWPEVDPAYERLDTPNDAP
ncbi:MAG: type II secretion system protein [Lachnospiraceae bacterium]|nr:type II secretion system protein [Lachnospiraceae bacterium]